MLDRATSSVATATSLIWQAFRQMRASETGVARKCAQRWTLPLDPQIQLPHVVRLQV